MAERRPLVLVFEDLHWADESLLDFIDELVDWVTDVPLLVVATSRPELLERRPGWGGGKLNATTLAVTPLSDEETARLIAGLLDRPVLAANAQQVAPRASWGQPALRGTVLGAVPRARARPTSFRLPETLQGIIAARLDGLTLDEKELLRDASVIGKVFWVGALEQDGDAAAILHALERKGFVRRQRRTSVEGETELAFAHALVRDVAYGQISRPDRVEKHSYVARWIESLGRPEDHAEMLAHHWRSSLELAQVSGKETPELVDATRLALRDAGDRAVALNAFGAAKAYYTEALSIWPEESSDRADLLFRRAGALYATADEGRVSALEEARDALLAGGDRETAAEAEAYLSRVAWYAGQRDAAQAHVDRAAELVDGAGPSIAKARVLAFAARLRFLAGDLDEGIRIADEALALADELELDELRAHALTTVGSAKTRQEGTGLAELERALEIATSLNSPLVSNVLTNLGVQASQRGDLRRAGALYREGVQAGERFGDRDSARFIRGNLMYIDFFLGNWDQVVADADRFITECETSPHYMEGAARVMRGYLRLARGDQVGGLADLERNLALARAVMDPQRLAPALLQSARGLAMVGRTDEARTVAMEGLAFLRNYPDLGEYAGQIAGFAKQLGIRDEIQEIVAQAPDNFWTRAAVAAAAGDFIRAADIHAEYGAVAIEAGERFHAAEELIAEGRRHEGEAQLEKALAFYRSVGATFYVERAEALLRQTATA